MTSFTFTTEQVRSAPPEVKRWIEREIAASLAVMSKSEHDPSQVHAASLAACMPEEAMQLFDLIKVDFLLAQVFFELARETPNSHGAAPLYPISIADILRHTRLGDGDRLVDCFTAINQAFRSIRNDPEATLFGFDQFEDLRSLLGQAGREGSRMDLRRVVFGLPQRCQRCCDLAFDPAPHLRRGRPHLFDGKGKTGHLGYSCSVMAFDRASYV